MLNDKNVLNLSKPNDLKEFIEILQNYFPNAINESSDYYVHTLLYYFDHKIGDYLSSLPSIYHSGIIQINDECPEYIKNKKILKNYPHGNSRNILRSQENFNKEPNKKFIYYPFIKNCYNPKAIMSNLGEIAKENQKNICIQPIYKRKFNIPNHNELNDKSMTKREIKDLYGTETENYIEEFKTQCERIDGRKYTETETEIICKKQ